MTTLFKTSINIDENKIFIYYQQEEKVEVSITILDIDSKHAIYCFDSEFSNYSSVWTIPIPVNALNNYNRSNYFRGYEICIYERNRVDMMECHTLWYNENAPYKERVMFDADPWNLTWINYTEMFVEEFYHPLQMQINGVCLDIGANDGLYTEYLLRNGADRVYAIECDPRSVKFLNKRFNSDNRVVVVDKGMYSKNETGVKLSYQQDTSTTSSLIKGVHQFTNDKYFEIDTWDYTTLLRKMNIKKVNFFKIDIEGAEYEVFKSMTDEQIKDIDGFMVEIHWNTDGRIYQITDRLESLGFEIELRRHTEDNAIVYDRNEWSAYTLCTFYAHKSSPKKRKILFNHLRTTLNTDVEKRSLENIRGLAMYMSENGWSTTLKEYENEPYVDLPPTENCARPNAVSMKSFPNGINEYGETALTPAHYGCFDAFRKAFQSTTETYDYFVIFEGDAFVEYYSYFEKCINDIDKAIKSGCQIDYLSLGGSYHLESGELLSHSMGVISDIEWGHYSEHVPFAHCVVIPKNYFSQMREAFLCEPWDVSDLFLMKHFAKHTNTKQFVSQSQVAKQLNGFSLIDKKVKQYMWK